MTDLCLLNNWGCCCCCCLKSMLSSLRPSGDGGGGVRLRVMYYCLGRVLERRFVAF